MPFTTPRTPWINPTELCPEKKGAHGVYVTHDKEDTGVLQPKTKLSHRVLHRSLETATPPPTTLFRKHGLSAIIYTSQAERKDSDSHRNAQTLTEKRATICSKQPWVRNTDFFWRLSQYHNFLSLSSLTFTSQARRAWISGIVFLPAEYVILKWTQNAKKLLSD